MMTNARRLWLSLAVATAGLAPSAADAARTLYFWTGQSGGRTYASLAVTDGVIGEGRTVQTVACILSSGPCNESTITRGNIYTTGPDTLSTAIAGTPTGLFPITAGNNFTVPGVAPGSYVGTTVFDQPDPKSRLLIRTLADTEVAYFYGGRTASSAYAFLAVTDGVIGEGRRVDAIACILSSGPCNESTLTRGNIYTSGPDELSAGIMGTPTGLSPLTAGNSFTVPGVAAGSYVGRTVFDQPDPLSVLTIIGPVPRAAAVVPEPATWALMAVGFGMVGAAERRRRVRRPA